MNETLHTLAQAREIAHQIMLELMNRIEFTADDFNRLAKREGLSADQIKRLSGGMFKSYKSLSMIEKTGAVSLSRRNGSAPLPVWRSKQNTMFAKDVRRAAMETPRLS
jgi:hypothetical protein